MRRRAGASFSIRQRPTRFPNWRFHYAAFANRTCLAMRSENIAATAASMLVSTLTTLFRSNSARNAAARSGVSPHILNEINLRCVEVLCCQRGLVPILVNPGRLRGVSFGRTGRKRGHDAAVELWRFSDGHFEIAVWRTRIGCLGNIS